MQEDINIEIHTCSTTCTKCRVSIGDNEPRWYIAMDVTREGDALQVNFHINGFSDLASQKNIDTKGKIVFCSKCLIEGLEEIGVPKDKIVDALESVQHSTSNKVWVEHIIEKS